MAPVGIQAVACLVWALVVREDFQEVAALPEAVATMVQLWRKLIKCLDHSKSEHCLSYSYSMASAFGRRIPFFIAMIELSYGGSIACYANTNLL